MKITAIETKALGLPFKAPFHWAQGVAAEVILVCVHTDSGVTGYGESVSASALGSTRILLEGAGKLCIGDSLFDINEMLRQACQRTFVARNCSSPRLGAKLYG